VPGHAPWADRVVTISAAYGTRGTATASAVADLLDLPFVDRAIPAGVARSLAVPLAEAVARDQHRASLIDRIIMSMASGGSAFGISPVPPTEGFGYDEKTFQAHTEGVIRDVADSGRGGVVLGRAAAIVLAHHPKTILRVRLKGAAEARAAGLVARSGMEETAAAKLVEDNDRAIEDYMRHFYKKDPEDPALYHLVIDATALPFDACVELITTAVRACSSPTGPG
jgi:cytidylate kinase